MKNHRFIVSKALKTKYLECIPKGHLGVTKCLQCACEYLFWVNFSRDTQQVEKCTSTTQHHKYYS